jgi:hypothetical protein
MTSGGKVFSWAWLESSGLQLAGTCLLIYLAIRQEGMRRLGTSVGKEKSRGSNYRVCGAPVKAQNPYRMVMNRWGHMA